MWKEATLMGVTLGKFPKDKSPMFKLSFREKPLEEEGLDSHVLITAKVKVWEKAQEIEKGPVSIQLLQSRKGFWYVNDILRVNEWPEQLKEEQE